MNARTPEPVTRMRAEALEAPAAVARQLAQGGEACEEFARQLRADPPVCIVTIARGSSDHAAHYTAYLVMSRLGRVVASLPLSLITLHDSPLSGQGLLALAFSQSGQSPDLVAPVRFLAEAGATTAAFVNDAHSPLADASQWVFPLEAGVEQSVAATKSFIAQLVAGARLVAAWQQDRALADALQALPAALEQAAHTDWSAALPVLQDVDRLLVIGRGTGMAVALEAALKLKETCAIQAEAFSGAELRHGPMALVGEGFPLLVFAPRGPEQPGLLALAGELRAAGARVLLVAPEGTPGCDLAQVEAPAAVLDPVCAIQSFYPLVEALARRRGFDPDRPPNLAKVTRTR